MVFELTALDWDQPLGPIEDFERASIIARHNAVSTWDITLPGTSRAVALLTAANRPRIKITSAGATFWSGPIVRLERQSDLDGDFLTLSGVDDLVWLRRRLAHPQPGTAAPPYSTTAYDQQSGVASTVMAGYVDRNLGPSAVTARQVPGFTVPAPAALGPSISVQARYDNLLDFLVQIANSAGLGIRARDLTFAVYQPADVGAVFSVGLGTLAGWISSKEAPDSNYVYVGGQGEGEARLIQEYQDNDSYLAWGRFESFVDRRDSADPAVLAQAGAEALAAGVRAATANLEALDTPAQSFITNWMVGDIVTTIVGGDTIKQTIAEARIDLEANAPAKVVPVLGGAVV